MIWFLLHKQCNKSRLHSITSFYIKVFRLDIQNINNWDLNIKKMFEILFITIFKWFCSYKETHITEKKFKFMRF